LAFELTQLLSLIKPIGECILKYIKHLEAKKAYPLKKLVMQLAKMKMNLIALKKFFIIYYVLCGEENLKIEKEKVDYGFLAAMDQC